MNRRIFIKKIIKKREGKECIHAWENSFKSFTYIKLYKGVFSVKFTLEKYSLIWIHLDILDRDFKHIIEPCNAWDIWLLSGHWYGLNHKLPFPEILYSSSVIHDIKNRESRAESSLKQKVDILFSSFSTLYHPFIFILHNQTITTDIIVLS